MRVRHGLRDQNAGQEEGVLVELLYAVDLDVDSPGGSTASDRPVDRLRRHLQNWLSWGTDPVPGEHLLANGEQHAVLDRLGAATKRTATWQVREAGGVWALRVDVRQPLPGLDAEFVCRVTLGEVDSAASLRVVMGRDTSSQIISAIPLQHLRRPVVLGNVLTDADLRCTSLAQHVTGTPIEAPAPLLPELARAVGASRRLPLLLIDGAAPGNRGVADETAEQLAGLAQVVVLTDQAAVAQFGLLMPEAALPVGGARLLWPSLDVRHPQFTVDELRPARRSTLRLLRLIGPFAVAARGRDQLWEEAGRRARDQQTAQLRERVEAAGARGDVQEQVVLLQQQLEAKSRELEEYLDTFGGPLDADQQAQDLAAAQANARYWREQYEEVQRSKAVEPWWERVPDCDGGELEALANHLEQETNGAIVFTPRALTSWRRSAYPFPSAMRDALTVLGRAAQEWHARSGEFGMLPDDWLKITWGVNSAFSDQGLAKKKLHKFTYDGRELDRTPHLKLDDNTTPDRVGRVYFALDQEGWRFVVDHVGLKLYGL